MRTITKTETVQINPQQSPFHTASRQYLDRKFAVQNINIKSRNDKINNGQGNDNR